MKTISRDLESAAKLRSKIDDEPQFDLPDEPETIPEWAAREARPWIGLSRFDIEVRAEEECGLEVEIRAVDLPASVWGLHVARGDRARLCVNRSLPPFWHRFALFHELYHLISHSAGEGFWRGTFQPMSRFESEADIFAWAVVLAEREDFDDCGG